MTFITNLIAKRRSMFADIQVLLEVMRHDVQTHVDDGVDPATLDRINVQAREVTDTAHATYVEELMWSQRALFAQLKDDIPGSMHAVGVKIQQGPTQEVNIPMPSTDLPVEDPWAYEAEAVAILSRLGARG